MMESQISSWALETAAKIWNQPETQTIAIDGRLVLAFARTLECLGPQLGLATTRELLTEISTRIEIHCTGGLDYRTFTSGS